MSFPMPKTVIPNTHTSDFPIIKPRPHYEQHYDVLVGLAE